jgi:hypothetical protein
MFISRLIKHSDKDALPNLIESLKHSGDAASPVRWTKQLQRGI